MTFVLLVARGLLLTRHCVHILGRKKQEKGAVPISGEDKHSHKPPADFYLHLKGHNCVACPLLGAKEAGELTALSKTSTLEVRRKEGMDTGWITRCAFLHSYSRI